MFIFIESIPVGNRTSVTAVASCSYSLVTASATVTVDGTSSSSVSTENEHFNIKCFHYFSHERQKYFRCEICIKHPEVVRRFSYHRDKLPPIATEGGTRYRESTLKEHCKTVYHTESIKAEKIRVLAKPPSTLMPMDAILAKNEQVSASRAAKLLIQVS